MGEDITRPFGGNERILIVDDEDFIVAMMTSMLSSMGYNVTATTSSKKALTLLKAHSLDFDLFITDQTMPYSTGIELAKEALNLNPRLPVILCTGYANDLNQQQAKEAGISRYISKPFSVRELGKIVREVLDATPDGF